MTKYEFACDGSQFKKDHAIYKFFSILLAAVGACGNVRETKKESLMRKKLVPFTLLMLMALPVEAAMAQLPPQAAQEACRADARRFCADIKPGGGRIAKCLRPRLKELSPQCAVFFCNVRAPRADRQVRPECR